MTDIKKQNARNRRNGSKWQSDIRNGLRGEGFDIERLALTGKEDEGDHVIRASDGTFTIIEAKAGAMHAADFVKQTQEERANFAKHRGLSLDQVTGVAVIKARGKNWRDAYVLTTVADYFKLNVS